MTIRNIIFIIETKFTSNDFHKIGAAYYKNKNCQIHYLNIIPITRKNYFKNYNNQNLLKINNHKLIYNFSNFKKEISKHKNPIIFSLITRSTLTSQKIFNFLNNQKIIYYAVFSGGLPIPTLTKKEIIYNSIYHPYAAIGKIFDKIKNYRIDNFRPKIKFINRDTSINTSDEFYNVPSYDYDSIILWNRNKNKEINLPNDYYVLLETPYSHPDGFFADARFPPEIPCSFDDWYGPLNKFLNNFYNLTKSQIIIIPHPRTTSDCLNAIKTGHVSSKNKIDLIKNSKGVMTFSSSALSIGIFFDKPILFLDQFNFTYHNRRNIQYLTKYFNTSAINMDKNIKLEDVISRLNIDKNSYMNFKKNYLGFPSDETSFEKIYNKIIGCGGRI